MSIAITEEHRSLADTVRRWAGDRCDRDALRTVVDDGADLGLHAGLAAQGLVGLHVAEGNGGAGYGAVELAITLEELGRVLAPGPFLPTTIVSAVLSLANDDVVAKELLPGLADGSLTAAAALTDLGLVATANADGLHVSGAAGPVMGAADADVLLLPVTVDGSRRWLLADAGDTTITQVTSSDPTRTLVNVTLDVTVPSARVLTVDDDGVAAVVATLASAEAVGVADWCLTTASDYAKVREQFGQPIGKFQAVKHMCADMLVRTEQARALAWDAARALHDVEERNLAAAAAAAVALDAAVDNAKDCIQVLGGIGFTWEHDAHLYLRRAAALRQLAGGTANQRRRVAELALAGTRRTLDLDLGPEADEVRRQVVGFVDEIRDLPTADQHRRVVDGGYAEPHWPAPYGRDASPVEQLVISEEFDAAGISAPDIVIGKWILPTIIKYGTDEQRERFVAPTLHGEMVWCQMFSEPGAGSDLAALSTRAERAPGGWRLNGQKIWTSLAHEADWALCIARTNPDAPKHKGITSFLIEMSNPGLDIRPLKEITGRAMFNEIFLDDVFVPDADVVGDVDDGWRTARTTLANERVAMSSGSSMGRGVEGVLSALGDNLDPLVADHVGHLVCEGQSLAVLGLRTTLAQLSGMEPGASSSVRKLVGMGHAQDVAELSMQMLGPAGATLDGDAARAVTPFFHARCLTIAGGTTEVQKNVVAERLLGLPRDDAR